MNKEDEIPKIKLEEEEASVRTLSKYVASVRGSRTFKILAVGLLFLLGATIVLSFLFYRVYQRTTAVQASFSGILEAYRAQDLPKIKAEIKNSKDSLTGLQNAYKTVTFLKSVPFLGGYVSDGEHAINGAQYGLDAAQILVSVVEPYADIIGFKPNASDEPEGGLETTQDRLDFVIKTIPDVIPKADELAEKIVAARVEIDQIDPSRYPVKFSGSEIRPKIQRGIELVDLAAELITSGKPLLAAVPYLLGVDESRRYLIIFQNDKELRPTGGFITAYSIANVENGIFNPVASNDIYNIDPQYKPKYPAPEPIIKYLKGPYIISKNLRLRDLNWSPDFSDSMEKFYEGVESVGIDDIDGIIAVDTQVVVNLLEVTGPIGVSGFGNFSTEIIPECDCPQVIYELESFADIEGPVVWSENEPGKIVFAPPNYENRKKIIGPLMNSLLANALGQPKDKLPALFEAAFKSLTEKHVLFYMLDEKAQEGVESFKIAGRMESYDGDYLHINDANLGGRKSNIYVTQEVTQEIVVARDGSVEKTMTITYKNPEEHDGWLNSVLPNWVRIYVPKGSELIALEGVKDKQEPYEEFGKTVFAGFFELRPLGVAKVTVKYKLPFTVDKEYKMFIQKQPGTDAPLYSIKLGKQEEELFLRTDKELKFKI